MVNLKNNQNGPWMLDLCYYLHENVPTGFLDLENVGQDTALVLLGQPQSSIFDKSSIFIGGQFKQIIKKATGNHSKDSIDLKT